MSYCSSTYLLFVSHSIQPKTSRELVNHQKNMIFDSQLLGTSDDDNRGEKKLQRKENSLERLYVFHIHTKIQSITQCVCVSFASVNHTTILFDCWWRHVFVCVCFWRFIITYTCHLIAWWWLQITPNFCVWSSHQ